MPDGDSEQYVISETERNDALATLVHATSAGGLTLDDFSRRTDAVLAARSRGELVAATQGTGAPLDAGRVKRRWLLLVGTRLKRGRFVLPELTKATVLVGELHVDLRGATLVGPEPTIRLHVLMGSLRLLVPRGIRVEVDQSSLFGGRTITAFGPPPPPANGPLPGPVTPVLRVRMVDVLGNVRVTDDPHSFSPDLFPAVRQ
ncbi:MAG: DUF1707 SHOCT-like domain-containing protein [Acidimicrobiales bacterium]